MSEWASAYHNLCVQLHEARDEIVRLRAELTVARGLLESCLGQIEDPHAIEEFLEMAQP